MPRLLNQTDGTLQADPIVRIVVQPMVLAGLETDPQDQELIRTRSREIERHLMLILARHGVAVVVDWSDDPGPASARGLLARTASGAILPDGNRRIVELRKEAERAMREACDHCE